MKRLTLILVMFFLSMMFTSFPEAQTPELNGNPYEIGIGDVIQIKVLGHRDLDVMGTVAVDGTIAFPNLGSIYVKDKTILKIKDTITKKLSEGYIQYPVVSVSLIQALSKRIFVHGEVHRIGMITFEKDITIVKAISMAGGIREEGLYGKLKLRRKQGVAGYKEIIEEELDNGFIKNEEIENTILQPDDILIVERNERFLIQGEVRKHGRFVLEKDMTVLRALLEAGGTSEEGRYGTIKVRRKAEEMSGGYKDIAKSKINNGAIERSEVEDTILQPDDILIVERNDTFLIQGEVARRGRFVLEKDMTVLRALLEAGGTNEEGRYGTIKVRRKAEEVSGGYKNIAESKMNDGVIENTEFEDTILQPDDILIVERNDSFLFQGEVARRGRFLLEKDMTVLRALLEAGGTSKEGRYGTVKIRRRLEGKRSGYEDIAESKINDGTIENSEFEDIVLQHDDILIVNRNESYYIYGEANVTGEFVLKDNMTVFKAMTIARGFTKWGSGSRVKILRLTNTGEGFVTIKVNIKKVLNGDATADTLLLPEDVIVVSSGIM